MHEYNTVLMDVFGALRLVPLVFMSEQNPVNINRPISIREIQGGAKNGASLSHCKYFENSMTELRGNW